MCSYSRGVFLVLRANETASFARKRNIDSRGKWSDFEMDNWWMSKGTILKLKKQKQKIECDVVPQLSSIQPLFEEQRHAAQLAANHWEVVSPFGIHYPLIKWIECCCGITRTCFSLCVSVCCGRQYLSGHSAPQAMVCVWKGMDPPQGVQGGGENPYSTFAAVCPLTQ